MLFHLSAQSQYVSPPGDSLPPLQQAAGHRQRKRPSSTFGIRFRCTVDMGYEGSRKAGLVRLQQPGVGRPVCRLLSTALPRGGSGRRARPANRSTASHLTSPAASPRTLRFALLSAQCRERQLHVPSTTCEDLHRQRFRASRARRRPRPQADRARLALSERDVASDHAAEAPAGASMSRGWQKVVVK